MAKTDDLVKGFLAQKNAVDPRICIFNDAPCYPDLGSIPEKPDAVYMLTNPGVSRPVVVMSKANGIAVIIPGI